MSPGRAQIMLLIDGIKGGLPDSTTLYLALFSFIILVISTRWFLCSSHHEKAIDIKVLQPPQCRPDWKGESFESPACKATDLGDIHCCCPATGETLGFVKPAGPKDIDQAIEKAQRAQIEWAKSSLSARRKVLKTLHKYILENQGAIATAACRDSGKTRIDACFGEILVTAEKIKWTLDHGEKALCPDKRPTNMIMFYKKNKVVYEPLGVVAACVSWNYPFHNIIGPVISAIFSGNAIVVKGSEQTAWSSSAYFASIIHTALRECGHNPDLVQFLVCWPKDASYLVSHPSISHVTFIGSQSIAHLVAEAAAKSLTPVCLELGGKDPAILLDDITDFERVVATLIRGTFQAAGQSCIGIERIICLPKIYPRVLRRLQSIIEQLRPGSALHDSDVDVGASISDANFDKLENLISDAVSNGARLLVGGKRFHHPVYPKGHYFSPTLLVDVTSAMEIAQTELFAPICVLMKAESTKHAIEIANSTEYALGASVFGSNPRDLAKVTRGVKAGMVAVNDFAAFYMVQLPFGGTKGSGYGRFAGSEGLRSLCNLKSVCEDRWPWLINTTIPRPLQLPIASEAKAWSMCQGIVEVGYGENLRRRLRGIARLIGMY